MEQTVEKDGVRMKFLNASIEVFARWLLQATVLAPMELKNRLQVLATQIYRHYQ